MLLSELEHLTKKVRIYLSEDENHLAHDPWLVVDTRLLALGNICLTDELRGATVVRIDPSPEPNTLNVWVIPTAQDGD